MAWTTPRTWVTGELVTAAIMNTHVRDNEDYLKTETDKLDDVTQAQPARVLGTVYQNTSGKIRMVTVAVSITTNASSLTASAYCAATDPPSGTPVAEVGLENFVATNIVLHGSMSFGVPLNYYYSVTSAVGIALQRWTEWDLH